MTESPASPTDVNTDVLAAPACQVMKAVPTCLPYASLKHAFDLLRGTGCGALPVVDADDRLIGILTQRDLCDAACTEGKRFSDLTVQSAMSFNVKACSPHDSVARVLQLMNATQFHEVPVVDGARRVVGVIDMAAVAAFLSRAPQRDSRAADALLETIVAVSEPPPEYSTAAE